MKYSEHPAGPALAERIECIWIAEDPGRRAGRRPSGSCPTAAWNGSSTSGARTPHGSGTPLRPRAFVARPTTRPLEIAPTGPVSTMGVRFRPGGARGLLPPLSLFTARFRRPRRPGAARAGAPRKRSETRRAFGRGERSSRGFSRSGRNALARRARDCRRPWISSSRGGAGFRSAGSPSVSAAAAASSSASSPKGVGLSPKELSRIARFQNVLRLAGRNPAAGWADLAARCGYADQAHLVREFKALSGATPSSREALSGALARYFIDPARLDMLLRPGVARRPRTPPVAFLQDRAGEPA